MIVVRVGIVIDRAGALVVPIHDQPDLRGTHHLTAQTEDGILMDVTIDIPI